MCTEERKPHKHAAVIKAWADGVQCQFRTPGSVSWQDLETPAQVRGKCAPAWVDACEYRVKPTTKRTVGYRRYLYKGASSGKVYPAHLFYEDDLTVPEYIEKRSDFVRWIDTEWQYYEWEE
jgi:hypothetical protein